MEEEYDARRAVTLEEVAPIARLCIGLSIAVVRLVLVMQDDERPRQIWL